MRRALTLARELVAVIETVIDAAGPAAALTDQLLETRDVLALLKVHRATLRAMIKAGTFPAPRPRASAKAKQLWRRSDVDAWIAIGRPVRPKEG